MIEDKFGPFGYFFCYVFGGSLASPSPAMMVVSSQRWGHRGEETAAAEWRYGHGRQAAGWWAVGLMVHGPRAA